MSDKKIIILEKLPDQTTDTYSYLLWADVPVQSQQYFVKPGYNSMFVSATPIENGMLQSGMMVERNGHINVRGMTANQVSNFLRQEWQAFQQETNDYQTWKKYGTYWDGSGWNFV